MADFLPWFPLDFEAFKQGTRGWTAEERWTYLELLWEQWDHGGIPNEPGRLHLFTEGVTRTRFIGMWRARISAKFEGSPGGLLVNPRMAEERAKEVVKQAQARAAGRLSGESRRRKRSEGSTDARAPLTEAAGNNEHPLGTDHMDTSSYSEKPTPDGGTDTRAGATRENAPVPANEKGHASTTPPGWTAERFRVAWINALQKQPGDRYDRGAGGVDRHVRLAQRIAGDAELLRPPMAPADYAEALMRATGPYSEQARRDGMKGVPAAREWSVAAFEGWYDKLAAFVAQSRAVAAPTPAAAGPCTHQGPRASYGGVKGWFICSACKAVCAEGRWYPQGQEPAMPSEPVECVPDGTAGGEGAA